MIALGCLLLTGVVAAQDPPQLEAIYRYRTRRGRTAYVNGLARVPAYARTRARAVDLSHVSLNEDLAAELQEAVQAQLSELRASGYCASTRALAERSWWHVAWGRHGHWVAIGGLLLLFLLASPYLLRVIGAARWARILLLLVPICGVLVATTTVAVRTSRVMRRLRRAAEPCGETAHTPPVRSTPGAAARDVYLLESLREQLAAAHRLRGHRLEQFLESEGHPDRMGHRRPFVR
jgi:hypothetical protein